ncbi:FtsK/SpoIIIE domain-containing protein [Streptomyces sp. NPDC012510]|uniref:FtsK/SpoIIIE domain-containing protein n=1 Tax=Streptomyces sp. NPDC012510 TaxID=3364838 RepID=UPI0036F11E10
MSRRRYEVAPAGGTSLLTVLGLAQDGADLLFTYGSLTVLAGATVAAGLKHKNQLVTHVGAGGFIALADVTTAVAAGFSWPTATAWALSTGAAYGVYGPWLATQRNARMKLHVDTVKAKGAVPEALGLEAADPGLTGASPEETVLRRGFHALTGAVPLAVHAFHRMADGSWSCLIKTPPGKNTAPAVLVKRAQQLQANMGVPGRLVLAEGPEANDLIVKVAMSDALATTLEVTDTGVTTCREPVMLGRDEDGEAFLLRLLYRHTLVAGASDWGKSGIVNLILKRLNRCEDVDLYGIDMKPGAPELGPWEGRMEALAKNAGQARELLEFIRAECDRRGAILAELSRQAMSEGRGPVRKWVPGEHGNAIFVVTDELAELVRQDAELSTLYESLLAIARFLAIQFVSATQQPSRKVFGGSTDARGNYANRLSTRAGEAGHAPFIFGSGCQSKGWRPELLDLPGKFLAQTPEHDTPRVYRAEYVSDTDIAEEVGFFYSDMKDTEPQPALTDEPWVEQFAPLRFPDGGTVGRDQWPDLYRVFASLDGGATKKELAQACGISRDTAMRAIEEWTRHGVQQRRDGRSTRYYLPGATGEQPA